MVSVVLRKFGLTPGRDEKNGGEWCFLQKGLLIGVCCRAFNGERGFDRLV